MTWYHGGVPGLAVGDRILPPDATGTDRRLSTAAEDPNAFWRLQSGDHLNLLEEAIEEVDRLREENADLETRRLGWKIAAETGVDTIRELRAELEAVKDARAAEADEYTRQLRALPGWCRACPPGCASCLGPDCECYEHQDRESATTPLEGGTDE